MTWLWKIATGEISHDGLRLGSGYSGFADAHNDPTKVRFKMTGPIPPGRYTIGPEYTHAHLGPITMNLEPDPANEMFGRSLFRIHGDNRTPEPFDGSHGCIVLAKPLRRAIAAHKDRELEVVA